MLSHTHSLTELREEEVPLLGQVRCEFDETKVRQGREVGNEGTYSQGSVFPRSETQVLGFPPA